MKSIRVLLADDHNLVRAGIAALLQSLKGVEVVAEARDGHEALQKIATAQPDIVLLDIAMPRLNGLETAARISKEWPAIGVIMLSMYTHEEYILRALHVGAAGYLLKDATDQELEIAIRAVARGETYLSPPISKFVTDYLRRHSRPFTQPPDLTPYNQLTPRQREVLQLIAEGYTTQKIAQLLDISTKTVETHRKQIMDRLDIHDIPGLVRYAIRTGLVTLDP